MTIIAIKTHTLLTALIKLSEYFLLEILTNKSFQMYENQILFILIMYKILIFFVMVCYYYFFFLLNEVWVPICYGRGTKPVHTFYCAAQE